MDEKAIKLVVAEGCGYCEEIKDMKLENVEIIDVETDEARKLLNIAEGSIFVPAAFDSDGNKCEIFIEDGVVRFACDKITVIETGEEGIILENDKEYKEDDFEEEQ